jgi:hypothetical protein
MKVRGSINFAIAFMLVVIWVVLILFDVTEAQSKINIWTYAFLVIGVITLILEEKFSK